MHCFELTDFLNVLGCFHSHMWNTYPKQKKEGGKLAQSSNRPNLNFECFSRPFSHKQESVYRSGLAGVKLMLQALLLCLQH